MSVRDARMGRQLERTPGIQTTKYCDGNTVGVQIPRSSALSTLAGGMIQKCCVSSRGMGSVSKTLKLTYKPDFFMNEHSNTARRGHDPERSKPVLDSTVQSVDCMKPDSEDPCG